MAYEHSIAVVRKPAQTGYMQVKGMAFGLYNLIDSEAGQVWSNAAFVKEHEYIYYMDSDNEMHKDNYDTPLRRLPAKEFRIALEKTKRKCDPEGGAAWDLFKALCTTVENYPDEYILIGWGE